MPEVSVIIPNYNHAVFLQQRIDSVLNQTFRDFEVIILDDCSSDNSKEVIESYRGHDRISAIIYNEINSGSTFKQWLKGISLASGNYIWIAESDDWCEPTFLENIFPPLERRPDCVIGFCQSYWVIGNELLTQGYRAPLERYMDGRFFLKNFMISGNTIYNASMAVWKKSAFEKIPTDFVDYTFCGDWLFWMELSVVGNVFISARVLNYFRKHDKDVSGNAYGTGYNFLEELKLLKAMSDKNMIESGTYKKEVAKKFFFYKRNEDIIASEMRKNIKEVFTKGVPYNYLYKNYLLMSMKYRGYKYLKKIIEKYR